MSTVPVWGKLWGLAYGIGQIGNADWISRLGIDTNIPMHWEIMNANLELELESEGSNYIHSGKDGRIAKDLPRTGINLRADARAEF